MTVVRYDISFSGRVQGVFFRATTRDIACRFKVSGWVRNEADGSVRCVVEGEAQELELFLAGLRCAKASNIDAMTVRRADASGEFDGFSIR